MRPGDYETPYHDLLAELRRRELAVLEQRNRVSRFELDMLSSANFSTNSPEDLPKPKRTKNKIVHGFVIEALNSLPVEYHHQRNGNTKLTSP